MTNQYMLPPTQLLVVNARGHIRELYCPFRVQCIKPVLAIPLGAWVYVEAVRFSPVLRLQYCICGKWYAFDSFAIVIHF